ncbi:MAG: hypothetical protein ACRDRO_01615, partial [Pseudonocardiaceae bacterium]
FAPGRLPADPASTSRTDLVAAARHDRDLAARELVIAFVALQKDARVVSRRLLLVPSISRPDVGRVPEVL